MQEEPSRSPLPELRLFKEELEKSYRREITPEELRLYLLVEKALLERFENEKITKLSAPTCPKRAF